MWRFFSCSILVVLSGIVWLARWYRATHRKRRTRLFDVGESALFQPESKFTFWEGLYVEGRDGEWSVPYASTALRQFFKERPRGFVPHGVAVELGCGRGTNVLWMAQQGFRKVVGVDISPTAVEAARETLAAMQQNGTLAFSNATVEFYAYDVLELPPPNEPITLLWDGTVHQNAFINTKHAEYFSTVTRLVDADTIFVANVAGGDFRPDGEDYSNVQKNSVMLRAPLQFNDKLRRDFGQHFQIHEIRMSLYDLIVDAPPFEHLGALDKWPVRKKGIPAWRLTMQKQAHRFNTEENAEAVPTTEFSMDLYMNVERLVEKGQAKAGVEMLEDKYLQFNPANAKALYEMAEILERGSEFALAADFFARVLRMGGPRDDVSLRLINALLRSRKRHEALEAARLLQRQIQSVQRQAGAPTERSKPTVFMQYADGVQELQGTITTEKELQQRIGDKLKVLNRLNTEL